MTRPKVPPDQRQRTATACETCRKRKQKCNGLCPCNTCEKRKFQCIYIDRGEVPSPPAAEYPVKRRATEDAVSRSAPATPINGDSLSLQPSRSPERQRGTPAVAPSTFNPSDTPPINGHAQNKPSDSRDESVEKAARSLQHFSTPRADDPVGRPLVSSATSQSGHDRDEEAVVYSQARMLQDPTGRFLYVGDSATLSCLQLIRMMVESVAGTSPFTQDPRRYRVVETQFSLPASSRLTHLLPEKRTGLLLAESYFVNTHGMIRIFDYKSFLNGIETTYADPLSAEPSWLCLLNLVFAIGLMLAVPRPGTPDALVIEKLRSEHIDRAEVFYLNAKSLNDPLTGFEDADFWSVQALLLMTVYMLAKSKRNTAFALLGMAVRSAYALGLHREETMVIFSAEDQAARKNLWKSLFVMDRFLSCSLGRPVAISEDDCSGDTLTPSDPRPEGDESSYNGSFQPTTSLADSASQALDAAVRSCSAIGTILKRVYQQRKISTRLAQEIADVCKLWPKALAPTLHWRQASSATPSRGIAILHVNLFYCHSIILLTRPFFLFILNSEITKGTVTASSGPRARPSYNRMEKFSEACVIASTHTVVLVQNAFEAGYLPKRNPTVTYFLFAAAVMLLSNEFAMLYANKEADQCIRNAIAVTAYCAEADPQASRLLYILSTFRNVVVQQRERTARQQQQANQLPPVKLKPHINPYGSASTFSPLGTSSAPMPQLPSLPSNLFVSSLPGSTSSLTSAPSVNGILGQQRTPPTSMDSPTTAQYPNIAGAGVFNHISPPLPAPSPRTTRVIEPALTPSAPHNPLSPSHSAVPGTPLADGRSLSLSNVLDLSALGPERGSLSEESSAPDEHIEFDSLWAWSSNTPAPAANTPRSGEQHGAMQNLGDSSVPLFGMLEMNTGL